MYPRSAYAGDFIDNAAGGRKTGAIGDNQVAYGVDLQKIIGIAGAKDHALLG